MIKMMGINIKKTKKIALSSAGCGGIVVESLKGTPGEVVKGTPGEVVESPTSWSMDKSYKIIMIAILF